MKLQKRKKQTLPSNTKRQKQNPLSQEVEKRLDSIVSVSSDNYLSELEVSESKTKSKAQKWLDKEYPKDGVYQGEADQENKNKKREEITKLNISSKGLRGSLVIEKFNNLTEINCSKNQLTKLDLSECPKLTKISCYDNWLKELVIKNFPQLKTLEAWNNQLTKLEWGAFNSQSLTSLSISNNNLNSQNLKDCFANFVNLEELYIGTDIEEKIDKEEYNKFFGSLKSLEKCAKLKKLQIELTDINEGLEYLPDSVEKIVWWGTSKSGEIFDQWNSCHSDIKVWKKWKNWGKEKGADNELIKQLAKEEFNNYKFIEYCEKIFNTSDTKNKKNPVEKLRTEYEKYKQAQIWLDLNYSSEERNKKTELDISSKYLKGELNLSDFTELEELNCKNNQLSMLELSKNTKLISIDCSNNEISMLELGENNNLIELNCSRNKLNDVSDFISKLSDQKKLKLLDIGNNPFSKELLDELKEKCSNLNLEEFSSEDSNVKKADDNKLKPRTVEEWLNEHYKEKKEIKELDISDEELEGKLSLVGFNELKYLICCGNKLTEIDLRGCKKLSIIDCRENELSNLIFNENFELEIKEFWGSNNKIKDVKNLLFHLNSKTLTYFSISNNNISTNISIFNKFTGLKSLHVDNNKFIRGSLKELKSLKELFDIDISNTSIRITNTEETEVKIWESNEILEKLEEIYCNYEMLPDNELKEYYNKEDKFYDIKAHREKKKRDFKIDKIIRIPSLSEKKGVYGVEKIKENYEIEKGGNYNEKWKKTIHPPLKFSWEVDEYLPLNRLPFRLYEVNQEQIKKRVECEDAKNYAILSYFWGGEPNKSIEWSIENAKDRLSKGGKKSLGKSIETLKILKEKYKLDIKYLWMDQLCIDQSNNKEKGHEISKMREYYGNSAITLIAIHTNIGEETIRKLSKSFEAEKSGLVYPDEIIKNSLPILEKIIGSDWFSRSWTFQEGFLSKQTIFMFNDYLIDGRFLALIWKFRQNSAAHYDECKQIEELCKEKVATPVGWVYYGEEDRGYGIRDKVSLRLNEALWAVKRRGRSIPVDGIYSIIGLLTYGKEVKVNYEKEPESVLREVMLIATKHNYGEPLAWQGSGSRTAGLCWLPEIDSISGSVSITGVINISYKCDQELNFTPNEGIRIQASEYIIDSVDKSNGIYSLDREEVVDGGLWIRKVWVKFSEKEEKKEKITLLGTKEGIKAVSDKRVLIVPSHENWERNESDFAILALKVKNNYHRIDLVRILEKEIIQNSDDKEVIIGLENQESTQKFQTQIEVNPYQSM